MFSFLEQHHMIVPHDHIIVGVSGGADSVCLLFVLLEYAKKMDFRMSVVHVDHGLRQDAAEDAAYVEKLCADHKIPFFLVRADVKGFAAREKCSVEDAGRRIRYEAFSRIGREIGAGKTAVAHNRNDRAETMLLHLFRGSGLKGLCGILPVRQEIIRPLLCLERGEIEAYLTERQIAWRDDGTNDTDDYARNRIRHHVLSYAEKELARGCVGRMAYTADLLAETEDYMERQTLLAKAECTVPAKAGYRVSVEAFKKLHPAIQKRLLYLLARQLSPTGKDIEAVHIKALSELFQKPSNAGVDLPFGIRGRRSYDTVFVEKSRQTRPDHFEATVEKGRLCEEESLSIDTGGRGVLEFMVLSGRNCEEVPKNQYTKWFDYDKIEEPLKIRGRETGDFLSISDGKGGIRHKSLKEYMIAQKIPKEKRDDALLLAQGRHVLWVVGGRISEYYKVDKNTKRILQVKLLHVTLENGCCGSRTEDKDE